MVTFADMNNNEIGEKAALGLPTGVPFLIRWDDGVCVECSANGNGTWTVGLRKNGELFHYGTVEKEGAMYRAVRIVYSTPQETFSAAARKYC